MTSAPATICFPFAGDTVGGSHISALTLVRNLDPAAFRPLIVVHQDGPLADYLRDLGLDYRLLPLPRTVGRDRSILGHTAAILATAPRLFGFIRREGIAAVHSNDMRMHLTWTLPAQLAGAKAIWHQRAVHTPSRLTAVMLRLANRIIAISNFIASGLPATARAKTEVVDNPFELPPSLDRDACRLALLDELGLPAETRVVGLFGNLMGWKRPLVFVEAAAQLADKVPSQLAFVVLGDDRDGFVPRMTSAARAAGIENRLFFPGFRTPVWPWLAACDLVLAPSVDEPFGRTLVEAMLIGTAVVATDSGGHKEIVTQGETGILVPPDDPTAMAAAAAELLDNPDQRAALVARAEAAARTRYRAADHARDVARIYRSVLAQSRPGVLDEGLAPDAPVDIALVISDLGSGGAQRVLTTLANAWAKQARRVAVITFDDGRSDFFGLAPDVTRLALNRHGKSRNVASATWANLRRLWALRRALRATGAATIVSFVGATNILTVLAARGLGTKVVICERNDPARQSLGRPWDWLRRRLYRKADVVTANSKAASVTLSDYVRAEKLRVLPNPLVLPEIQSPAKIGAPTVLTIGRLDRQKAHDILLDAFARCAAREAGWRLEIVGQGPLRQALTEQADDLGISDQIDWRGSSDNPFAHYAVAQIFVLPSRFEGTPNVVLEAMAIGLPVIVSTATGGALDYVEDGVTGLVVAAEDRAGLARAIDRLSEDEVLRQRLGEAAKARVEACRLERVLPLWDQVLSVPKSADLSMGPPPTGGPDVDEASPQTAEASKSRVRS